MTGAVFSHPVFLSARYRASRDSQYASWLQTKGCFFDSIGRMEDNAGLRSGIKRNKYPSTMIITIHFAYLLNFALILSPFVQVCIHAFSFSHTNSLLMIA